VTDHEDEARERYAALSGRPPLRWSVVDRPEPDFWYDFFDPATGKYGQCRMGPDGRWSQAPRGEQPVVLRYRDPRKGRGA
jgi:hypothetical protein